MMKGQGHIPRALKYWALVTWPQATPLARWLPGSLITHLHNLMLSVSALIGSESAVLKILKDFLPHILSRTWTLAFS
jgi:hypothetical protein